MLTRLQVAEIRALYVTGRVTMQQLADRYGVNPGTVCRIVRGESWSDPDYVPPPSTASVLDQDQAHTIRELYGSGQVTMGELARRYGVNKGTISRIVNNKAWHDPQYTPPPR